MKPGELRTAWVGVIGPQFEELPECHSSDDTGRTPQAFERGMSCFDQKPITGHEQQHAPPPARLMTARPRGVRIIQPRALEDPTTQKESTSGPIASGINANQISAGYVAASAGRNPGTMVPNKIGPLGFVTPTTRPLKKAGRELFETVTVSWSGSSPDHSRRASRRYTAARITSTVTPTRTSAVCSQSVR